MRRWVVVMATTLDDLHEGDVRTRWDGFHLDRGRILTRTSGRSGKVPAVRLPRHVSPAAARRRSLLVDVVLGITIGICAIVVTAGIGVVGFFALICALVLLPWYLLEGGIRGAARRRRR
jgi:hypothetical protein